MFKSILAALVCAAVVLVSGCGGGGGGGASAPSITVTFPTQAVAAQAATYTSPMPSVVGMTLSNVPSGGVYIRGSYTTRALSTVTLGITGNGAYFTLNYRAPESLGVGVYTDTITVTLCLDQQCTQPVGSPQNVAVTFTVTANGAVGAAPVLSLVSPAGASAGGSDVTVAVTGSGFDSSSKLYWAGVAQKTIFHSATQLTALIPASAIAEAGAYPVVVTTASSSSAPSAIVRFTVVNSSLALTKLSPTSVTVGNTGFVETIIGTGFNQSSTVLWNGSARPTTFVSSTELLAQISASDVASTGTANVTVSGPGSSVSSAQTVTITSPSIDATAFQINTQHSGATNFANIVAPSAFPLAVKWTANLNGYASYALIAGGRVFATAWLPDGSSELYAFNASTGALVWGPVALPYKANASYDNGRVFVLTSNGYAAGTLSAFDAASGTQLWSRTLSTQLSFTAPPVAAHGMVYVNGGSNDGILYAVNQTDGAIAWFKTVDAGGATPAVTADGVYLSFSCNVYDFRPLTGEIIWKKNNGCLSAADGSASVVANDILYAPASFFTFNGTMFNAKTGASGSNYTSYDVPALGAQIGYFSRNGGTDAVRLFDGATQWSFTRENGLSRPILVNNYVFGFSYIGNLYALDATTGAQLWLTPLAYASSGLHMPVSGLSAGGGLLIVPTSSTLVAYTLSNNP